MRKGLTEVVFILDRSGSMRGLEADTIGGFNSMIERQQKEDGEAYVSAVLFDDECEVLYDRVDIKKIEPMNDNQYYVRGCTALLDAIGGAIHHIGNVHKYARPEDVPEKTLFIITTDGMENASRRYSYDRVKHMVERQKKQFGWEFLFLGANIDAVEVAGRFGIGKESAINYECDSVGTQLLLQLDWMHKKEETMTFYVIGNGFDLHYSLDTRYSSFKKYLRNVAGDVVDRVDDLFERYNMSRNPENIG